MKHPQFSKPEFREFAELLQSADHRKSLSELFDKFLIMAYCVTRNSVRQKFGAPDLPAAVERFDNEACELSNPVGMTKAIASFSIGERERVLRGEIADFHGEFFYELEAGKENSRAKFYMPHDVAAKLVEKQFADAKPSPGSRRMFVENNAGTGTIVRALSHFLMIYRGFSAKDFYISVAEADFRYYVMMYLKMTYSGAAATVFHGDTSTGQRHDYEKTAWAISAPLEMDNIYFD